MRAENEHTSFESWYGPDSTTDVTLGRGEWSEEKRAAWDAWQAALASPEVQALREDAKRLEWVIKNTRCDPDMSGNHYWWPNSFNQRIRGNTLRKAIDAAMEKQDA